MAEGTSLLRKHTGKTCIVGSNPTVSARNKKKGAPLWELIFFFWAGTVGFEDRALPGPGSPNRHFAGARRMRHLFMVKKMPALLQDSLWLGACTRVFHCPPLPVQ